MKVCLLKKRGAVVGPPYPINYPPAAGGTMWRYYPLNDRAVGSPPPGSFQEPTVDPIEAEATFRPGPSYAEGIVLEPSYLQQTPGGLYMWGNPGGTLSAFPPGNPLEGLGGALAPYTVMVVGQHYNENNERCVLDAMSTTVGQRRGARFLISDANRPALQFITSAGGAEYTFPSESDLNLANGGSCIHSWTIDPNSGTIYVGKNNIRHAYTKDFAGLGINPAPKASWLVGAASGPSPNPCYSVITGIAIWKDNGVLNDADFLARVEWLRDHGNRLGITW